MPHTLFISDLHLNAGHQHSVTAFRRCVDSIAPNAEALYILGDLFEYWAGDDDRHDAFNREILSSLQGLSEKGTRIYIMQGNRDLLMDKEMAREAGATLIDDPTLIDLYGTPTLLSHGDTLCTDDIEYQRFRERVRSPEFQKKFLAQPLSERKIYIEQLRRQSNEAKQLKSSEIMDVNNDAVAALLKQHHYPRLIHGHTHRPARHTHIVDGHTCERWVLSDWDGETAALRCDDAGCSVFSF